MNFGLTVLLLFATTNLCAGLPQGCSTFCKIVGPFGIRYECPPCRNAYVPRDVTPVRQQFQLLNNATTPTVPPIPSKCPPPNPNHCAIPSIASQPYCDSDNDCPRSSSGATGFCCDFGCSHPYNRALTKQCQILQQCCPPVPSFSLERCASLLRNMYCQDDNDCTTTSPGVIVKCCQSGCPNPYNYSQTQQCLELPKPCPLPIPSSCSTLARYQSCAIDGDCLPSPAGVKKRCCNLGCPHPLVPILTGQCVER